MKIKQQINRFFTRHETLGILLVLILLGAFTYIPRIWNLGFYAEDWYVLWGGHFGGFAKIVDMHTVDRPLLGLHSAILYALFGDHPLGYQIYALILRLACAFVVYLIVRMSFSNRRDIGFMAATLFVIYPGFLVQPVALTHANYLIACLLDLLSILISLKALEISRKSQRRWLLILSGLLAFVGYGVMEWFICIELMRLILIYKRLVDITSDFSLKKQVINIVKTYLPIGFFLAIFLVVRVFIFKSGRSTTDIGSVLQQILHTPFAFLTNAVTGIFKNVNFEIFAAWGTPIYRLTNILSNTDILISVTIALLAVFSFGWLLKETNLVNLEKSESDKAFGPQLVILGAVFVVVAVLPLTMIGRDLAFDHLFSKYTTPGILGVCLLMVGLICWIKSDQLRKVLLLTLVFLGVATNQLNTAYYAEFTRVQNQVWWQLSWRTRDLKDSTTLLALLPNDFRYSDNWEIWSQANLTYGSADNPIRITAEVINNETLPDILNGSSYGRTFRKIPMSIDLENALVLSLPASDACLHVIDSSNNETLLQDDDLVRLIGGQSDISLLDLSSTNPKSPNPAWFGKEPEHGWCYFYQKASYYRQQQDWTSLAALADEAQNNGIQPANVTDWLPMYEGYVYTDQLDKANTLSNLIKADEKFVFTYCPLRIASDVNQDIKQKFITDDICSWYLTIE